jgi:hypothetical protein
VAIEGIASEHYDVRVGSPGRVEHAGKPRRAIATMQACSVVMINMQVRTMNDHDVAGRRHGPQHNEIGVLGKSVRVGTLV